MVATRNHPSDFKEVEDATPPQESPRKRTTRNSAATNGLPTTKATSTATSSATANPIASSVRRPPTRSPPHLATIPIRTPTRSARDKHGWSHTPSNLSLLWYAISLPLVIWDTGYVLLRPHSMPGGKWHAPWSPYALYGTIDHVYGFKAWDAKSGWTAAQASVNVLETIGYLVYLYMVYTYGEQEPRQGRGAPNLSQLGRLRALGESRTVYGKNAAIAVLLAYTVATVTFWKTVLYMLIETFAGFDNVAHNDWSTLFFLWIVPNGSWLVFPIYLIYVYSAELYQGLEFAAESRRYRR